MSEIKPATIWELLNDITSEKRGLFHEDEMHQKAYNIFIFNLMLSQHPDCILIINQLNAHGSLSKKWHHDFLFHKLPRRKRFAKLAKPEEDQNLDNVMEVLNLSREKASEMMFAFSAEDFAEMAASLDKGGRHRGTK
jgi:hypothetical protein